MSAARRRAGVGFLALAALAGCTSAPPAPVRIVETVEVKVPVPVHRDPTPELLKPIAPALPSFILPAQPEASSCLSPEGEKRLQELVIELQGRIAAWEAWANEEPPR